MVTKNSVLSIVKEIDSKEANIALKSNGIVYVLFKDHCVLDVDLQFRLLDSYNEITQAKLTPFIFLAAENVTITKEARDNATSLESISPLGASAAIVTNLAYKLIANFYMRLNKPKRPFKTFSSEEDAVDWLKSIKMT
jgi:hypothetical protein